MKSLSLKKLEQDKAGIERLIQENQIHLQRLVGALSYISDNIKHFKEDGDDRSRINNEKQV